MDTVFFAVEAYAAFVVLVVLLMGVWIGVEVLGELLGAVLNERAERRQWQRVNADASEFRRELDSVDLTEEMRRLRRAA
jgi:predicted nucleic acid-binding protein